jgi:hypothetical protein
MYYQHPCFKNSTRPTNENLTQKKHIRANLKLPPKLLLEDLPAQVEPSPSGSYFNRKDAKHHKE